MSETSLCDKEDVHSLKLLIMNRQQLFNKIIEIVPVNSNMGKDFRVRLRSALTSYVNNVILLNIADRCDGWDELIRDIKSLVDGLNNSVLAFYKGQHSTVMKKLTNQLKKSEMDTIIIGSNQSFYRMRTFDNRKRNIEKGELFHIPLTQRGIVKTQRYSMSGYPCLYLGESIYSCWEEMERPNTDMCMFSRLKNLEPLNVIDMRIPSQEAWDNDMKHVLKVFPWVIACMVVVDDSKKVFKAEYIIPQLLTEWVIAERERKRNDVVHVHGIRYTSAYKNGDFGFPDRVFDNVAIPVFNSIKGKYCKVLSSMFHITSPTCFEYEELRGLGEDYGMDDIPEAENCYRVSKFGMLENKLRNEELFPLQELGG